VAPLYGAEAPKPKPKDPKAAATAELQGRIRKLIKDVGDLDYDIRTAASKELIKIGRPALELLEAATKDKDAERVWRAKELVYYISRLPKPTKVDRKCTNGYMPVHGTVKQLQTFTPDADVEIDCPVIAWDGSRQHELEARVAERASEQSPLYLLEESLPYVCIETLPVALTELVSFPRPGAETAVTLYRVSSR